MYRIGYQCFATKDAATDYQMSLVAPAILSDGSMHYPIKKDGVWTYHNQVVDLSFGECNPEQDFYNGVSFASVFIALFAAAFVCKFASRWLWQAFIVDESNNQGD